MHEYLHKYFENIKKLANIFPIRNMRPLSNVSPLPRPGGGVLPLALHTIIKICNARSING